MMQILNSDICILLLSGLMIKKLLSILIPFLVLVACNDYTPKPTGDNRIERTVYKYKEYETSIFSFEYPEIAQIQRVPVKKQEYWFNIEYPDYNAVVYCTHLPITPDVLPKVLEDSYHLAYSHSLKADGINQMIYSDKENHLGGILYQIEGSVATPLQFFVTDSVSNFLRGSLYYKEKINTDSVAPITAFIKEDIMKMMSTIRFKNKPQ
jgi:gliding motility-associated lipoprotein GldD